MPKMRSFSKLIGFGHEASVFPDVTMLETFRTNRYFSGIIGDYRYTRTANHGSRNSARYMVDVNTKAKTLAVGAIASIRLQVL